MADAIGALISDLEQLADEHAGCEETITLDRHARSLAEIARRLREATGRSVRLMAYPGGK